MPNATVRLAALALAASCWFTDARAQDFFFGSNELVPTVVASGIGFGTPAVGGSGSIEVDGAGNLWCLASPPGSLPAPSIIRMDPSGAQLSVALPAPVNSDLVRGTDGNIWYWSQSGFSTPTPVFSLVRITPSGIATIAVSGITYPAFPPPNVIGIAQDPSGTFYMGGYGGRPIYSLAPGSTSLSIFSGGWTPNRLIQDDAGALFVCNTGVIVPFPVALGSSTAWYSASPSNGSGIVDGAVGWPGTVFALVSVPNNQAPWVELVAISGAGVFATVARIWATTTSLSNNAFRIAAGTAGDLYVQGGDTIWRLSGRPAVLTQGRTPNGSFQLRLDGPPGHPIAVGVDAPGFSLAVPSIGTFHTTLGLAPTFFALADDAGAFGPPIPTAGMPWIFTLPNAPAGMGISFTAEAYLLTSSAANGVVMISNPVTADF